MSEIANENNAPRAQEHHHLVGHGAKLALYILVFLMFVVLIVIFSVWLWQLTRNNGGKDMEIRDLSARDVSATSRIIAGCDLFVHRALQTQHAEIKGRLVTKPMSSSDPTVQLTKETSHLVLNSTSSTPVTVNLPQASNRLVGMQIVIINQSAASSFSVSPATGDVINGLPTTLTVSTNPSNITLFLAGLNSAANAYNWVTLV